MRVNIYYGGRGLIDDPTLYVLEKITKVLDELRVTVERYNLYEDKRAITVLPKTLKEADGVILAASLEWFGWRFSASVFGCMLAVWRQRKTFPYVYDAGCDGDNVWGERGRVFSDSRMGNAWRCAGRRYLCICR